MRKETYEAECEKWSRSDLRKLPRGKTRLFTGRRHREESGIGL